MPPVTAHSCVACHTPTVRYMFTDMFFYILVFVPMIVRMLTMLCFPKALSRLMSNDEQAREAYRSYLYAYLAISTAILLALTVANAKGEINLNGAVFCSVVSFIGFELALSLQSYKSKVYVEQISDGLIDTARFGVYLTIIAVINSVNSFNVFTTSIIISLLLAYITEFIVRSYFNIVTM